MVLFQSQSESFICLSKALLWRLNRSVKTIFLLGAHDFTSVVWKSVAREPIVLIFNSPKSRHRRSLLADSRQSRLMLCDNTDDRQHTARNCHRSRNMSRQKIVAHCV